MTTTPTDRTGFIYVQHDCLGTYAPEIPRAELHSLSRKSLWRCPDCGTIWEPTLARYPRSGGFYINYWSIVATPARDAMIHEIYRDLGMEGLLS